MTELAPTLTIDPASPVERRRLLLDRLGRDGRLVAADLSRELGVSEDTIRRDLRELAGAGLIERVHGGALPPTAAPAPPARAPFARRVAEGSAAKARLAQVAAGLVRPGDTVILDSGTTILAVAQALPLDLAATVVTASPAIAVALAEHPLIEVIMVGGRVAKHDQVVTGSAAVDQIRRIHADLCLLAVCSLDRDAGITASDFDEAELKRAMIGAARRVVAVVTAAKIGTAAPFHVAGIEALTDLVTEPSVGAAVIADFSARSVAIITA